MLRLRERVTVNHDVAGSSPAGGAKNPSERISRCAWVFCCFSRARTGRQSDSQCLLCGTENRKENLHPKASGGFRERCSLVRAQQGEPRKSHPRGWLFAWLSHKGSERTSLREQTLGSSAQALNFKSHSRGSQPKSAFVRRRVLYYSLFIIHHSLFINKKRILNE